MSVGVEVDALALMLDGASNPRLCIANVNELERPPPYGQRPLMERYVDQHEWAEVAEAIMELEGMADWLTRDEEEDEAPDFGSLADAALRQSMRTLRARRGRWVAHDIEHLEAAALLRDGWRPGGEP